MKYVVQPINHEAEELTFGNELDAISYALIKPSHLLDIRCPTLNNGKTYFYWQTIDGLVGYKIICYYTSEDVYDIINDGECSEVNVETSRFDSLQDKQLVQLVQLLGKIVPYMEFELDDQWVDIQGNRYDSYIEGMLKQVLKLVKERF